MSFVEFVPRRMFFVEIVKPTNFDFSDKVVNPIAVQNPHLSLISPRKSRVCPRVPVQAIN